MRQRTWFKLTMGGFLAVGATLAAGDAVSAPRLVGADTAAGGFAAVYGDVPADQAEFISTPDAIKSAAANGAPTLIWETLEHGEKVECLDCIAAVAPLLYDANAKNREIAAWWLRRRIFGVFGAGEVYQQTVQVLASDPDPVRRAFAATALGEFLAAPGIVACAQAVLNDADPGVRSAAAGALGRLNSEGSGALGMALADSDVSVRLAALGAAARVNTFSGVSGVAGLAMDPDVNVRRRAMEVLDGLGAKDSVMVALAAAQKDADPGVRAAACHALGTFGDMIAQPILQTLAQSDSDTFVRDQAKIALRRL